MNQAIKVRDSFKLANRDLIRWFPGHMKLGLRQMEQKLKTVDCVVEVHDARIPFSGRNPDFKYTVSGIKPHLLILNKKDLSDSRTHNQIQEKIRTDEGIDNVIYTNCKDQKCSGVRKIIPIVKNLINNSNRFNRSDTPEFGVMIIGVPNVGKSSLINALRNRHLNRKAASPVGAIAGITRSVLNKIKISEEPLIYLLDTPGILTPKIKNIEVGMKLALCSCLQDHLVGADKIADFLLYWMNKNERYDYVTYMGLTCPTDNIGEVLLSGAKHLNKTLKVKHWDGSWIVKPDLISAAEFMLRGFRSGEFGRVNLDKLFN